MLALSWQTLLILTLAYLAGCLFGCLLRRSRGPDQPIRKRADLGGVRAEEARSGAPAAGVPAAGGTPAGARRVDVAAPAARAAAVERIEGQQADRGFKRADHVSPLDAVAPRILQDSAQPTVSPRGQRATADVSPVPKVEAPRPIAIPAPADKSDAPAAPVAVVPAPKVEAPRPVTIPAPVPKAVGPAPGAGSQATAAAAAAAAAATVRAAVTQPVAPAAKPVQPVVPMLTPGVARPVTAPSAVADPAPRPRDDLTRIRAIDKALEAELNRLGILRFADIARWAADDVKAFSSTLGFRGRIEQENWIEQAQILSRGGETHYASRRARGEAPTAEPVRDEGIRAAPAARSGAILPTPSANMAAPVARAPQPPVGPVTLQAPVAPASSAGAPAVVERRSAVEIAAAAAAALATSAGQAVPRPADVASRAAFGGESPGSGTSAAKPQAPVTPVIIPVLTPAAAAPSQQTAAAADRAGAPAAPAGAAVAGRDNLQRIGGISAEIEKVLGVQGVSRYSQIAGWSSGEVERFDRLLGYHGRISRENWVEQSQILARGGETAYSRDFDRRIREGSQPHQAAKPAAAAPGVGLIPPLAPAVTKAEVPAPASKSADLAGMRSVRSEAYRSAEPSIATGPPLATRAPRSPAGDDLKRIRGIGVLIEKKLQALGVMSYEQIANWTAADIATASERLDFKGRIERENWVEQARILASGGQTEFSRRVDRGDVESSRDK